jgi:hypothetical protein
MKTAATSTPTHRAYSEKKTSCCDRSSLQRVSVVEQIGLDSVPRVPPRALNRHRQKSRLEGEARCEEAMTVWIYTDTSKQVSDPDHLKVFANEGEANDWF